jgi:putative transposase
MGQTFSKLLFHIVFSTKDRMPYLGPVRDDLFPYMGGVIRGIRRKAMNINGASDHVHILTFLSADVSVAEAVRVVKSNSSRWVHQSHRGRRAFAWQAGYSAFTVSESNFGDVSRYIDDQEEHHRKQSFQEELVAMLKKYNLPYDERYMWS